MHKRLGHPAIHALKQIMKHCNHTFDIDKDITVEFCSACQFGKSHIQHFPFIKTTTTQPLEIMHADL